MRAPHIILLLIVSAIAILLFAVPCRAAGQQPPVVTLQSVSCPENASPCYINGTKQKSNSYTKIRLRPIDGAAKAGTDFTGFDVSLTLGNNTTAFKQSVDILNNQTFQGDRTFGIQIDILRWGQVPLTYTPTTVTIVDDEAQPAPQPPIVDVSGEATIQDNFDTAAGLELTWYGPNGRGGIAGPSPDPVGAFRIFAKAGNILKDDPLVLPGQCGGSPHAHQFFGNTGTNCNSNYQSLRTTGSTTSGNWQHDPEHPINRSAYWMPAMRDGIGHYVLADYMNIYYKRNPNTDPMCKNPDQGGVGICTDLPNGIRYVFGANMSTMTDGPTDVNSQNHDAITFQCWGSNDGTVSNGGANGYYHSIPEVVSAGCPIGARLMIIAAAPNCWDGHNIDTPDHRSQMAFSNGPMYPGQFFRACPSDHPYQIPNLEVQIAFTTDQAFRDGKWELDSDRQMREQHGVTGPAGWTWHMDYWEAWSPAVKKIWHDNCINKKLTCSGGDLGNGTQIRDASLYPASAFPTHQLVSE